MERVVKEGSTTALSHPYLHPHHSHHYPGVEDKAIIPNVTRITAQALPTVGPLYRQWERWP